MKKIILTLNAVFFVVGCTSVPQKLDPDAFYKRDMEITVNGYQSEGVLVVPKAKKYDFKIEAKGKLDLFTFTTCHREKTKENAGEKGWFSDKKTRKMTFFPSPDIEASHLSCPVQLGGYERDKGRHSWGFVDFEHESLNLPALLKCNGSVSNHTGVSACQSKNGLIQEIVFSEPVLAAKNPECGELTSTDEKTFRFKMPKGQCTFRFLTKTGEKKWHRMTTLGYQQILIRED